MKWTSPVVLGSGVAGVVVVGTALGVYAAASNAPKVTARHLAKSSCMITEADTGLVVLTSATSEQDCETAIASLDITGDSWSRAKAANRDGAVVCVMTRKGHYIAVTDIGSRYFGKVACSGLESAGWSSDRAVAVALEEVLYPGDTA